MRRKIIPLVVMACVVVVLAGSLFFVKYSPLFKASSSSAASDTGISLLKVDTGDIEKMIVTNQQGSYTITRTAAKTWTVSGLGTAPVSSTAIQNACQSAASLSATDMVVKEAQDLGKYGLAKPRATIDVTAKGKEYVFLVGDESPLGNGYYIMQKGSKTVYLTSTQIESYFLESNLGFVDTSLVTVDSSTDAPNITSYTFGGTKRAQPVVIQVPVVSTSSASTSSSSTGISKDTMPYIVSPRLLADTSKLSTLASDLASISADKAISTDVSAANLAKYGLDKPQYTFSYTLKGKVVTLNFGNAFTDNNTDYIYVTEDGKNAIYRIGAASVSFYNWKIDDLISNLQFVVALDDLKTVTIQGPSQTWKFDVSGSGDSMKVTTNGKAVNLSNFRSYYQNVLSAAFAGFVDKPAGAQLYCKVTCSYKNSKPDEVMEFYTMDNQRCYWVVDGTGGMYVLKTSVDRILTQAQDVIDGKSITVY